MHGLPFQDTCHTHHVLIAGVGAGANEHLIHLNGTHAFHRIHPVRHVGAGHQRLQGIQVNFQRFVISSVCIRGKGCEILLPSLSTEELPGHFIAGEHRSGCAQLCAHVGDGSTLRHGQGCNALACVLHHLTHAALYRQAAQHFQNNILCRYARLQLPRQVHIHHLGASHVISTATHGHSHVQSACADGDHADAAASRGMAVRAQQGHAWHAEPLQIHLMANTVAGLGAPNAVLAGHGLDVHMVVGIFKAGLQGIVINISHRLFRAHTFHAQGFELQVGHGAC